MENSDPGPSRQRTETSSNPKSRRDIFEEATRAPSSSSSDASSVSSGPFLAYAYLSLRDGSSSKAFLNDGAVEVGGTGRSGEPGVVCKSLSEFRNNEGKQDRVDWVKDVFGRLWTSGGTGIGGGSSGEGPKPNQHEVLPTTTTTTAQTFSTLKAFHSLLSPQRASNDPRLNLRSTSPPSPYSTPPSRLREAVLPRPYTDHDRILTEKEREDFRRKYALELWDRCGGDRCKGEDGEASLAKFEEYVEEKERELWQIFTLLDQNHDMSISPSELESALQQSGINLSPTSLTSFISALDSNSDGKITFDEWRDFLLLLPTSITGPEDMQEVWRWYQVGRRESHGSGKSKRLWWLGGSSGSGLRNEISRLTQDGDVVLGGKDDDIKSTVDLSKVVRDTVKDERRSGEKGMNLRENRGGDGTERDGHEGRGKGKERADHGAIGDDYEEDDMEDEDDEEESKGMFEGAGRFLLAGGVAGAVSRTATAPFDRLKVYLITSTSTPVSVPSASNAAQDPMRAARKGFGALFGAVRDIYAREGVKGFFVGNGLNVVKIFPESAIKFLSYESAKRVFAKYVDKVSETSQISNGSRFMAGGIGGLTSQLIIYPIETLKTRVMSSTAGPSAGTKLILETANDMWRQGRYRPFFRGLTWGLVGVFPYSAIDMSTYEALKLAYIKYLNKGRGNAEDVGVLGSLVFGSLSGGIGATSVYPLNLIRTRLQAQGTPSHPQMYNGLPDVVYKTFQKEGIRGFYKGLAPTLLKVCPSIAISWTVYESSTKVLFAQEDKHDDHEDD